MKKDKIIAAILAILFGSFGLHKLYLGKISWIFYLLLCWTFIPGVVGFIEGIGYLFMSDQDFNTRYNK